MQESISILDAFRALDDICDEEIKQDLIKVKHNKKLKESVETIDISGRDMYDKGQAYFYARTGDKVDINGKKYEIAQDETHKIGYSDEILIKDLETGETSLIAKKDFIKDAQLLKEECKEEVIKEDKDQDKLGLPREVTFKASEVALDTDDEDPSDRLSDMLSDKYGFCHYGFKIDVKKNENGEPSEFKCYDIDWDTSESLKKEEKPVEQVNEAMKVNLMDDKEVEEGKELLHKEAKEHIEQVVDIDAESAEDLRDSYVGDAILVCDKCKFRFFRPIDWLKKDAQSGLYNVEDECPHCGATLGFKCVGQVTELSEPEYVSPEDKPEEEKVEVEKEVEIEEPKEETEIKRTSVIAEESLEKKSLIESLEEFDTDTFDTLINKYLNETYENVDNFKSEECRVEDNSILVEGTLTFKSNKNLKTTFKLSENKTLNKNRVRFVCENKTLSESKDAFSLIGKVNSNNLVCECFSYNYKTKKLDEEINVRGRVHLVERKQK